MRLIKVFNDAIRSRAFLHWSPQYLYNRFRLYLYEISHPDYPWLTQHANEILSHLIKKDHIGFEWGAGRSTLWFARRCKHLTSVEHDPFWYKKVYAALQKFNVTNCDLVLAKDKETYISLIDSFEDESLDFVLVDGLYRDECVIRSLRKIKSGGFLIIDNINWYIPSPSKSPGSRKEKPASPIWENLSELLKKWYCIWTTNGVTDTAIYVKCKRMNY
jgi:hypothetical protein